MRKIIITIAVLIATAPLSVPAAGRVFWSLPIEITAPIAFDKATAKRMIARHHLLRRCLDKAQTVDEVNLCPSEVDQYYGMAR